MALVSNRFYECYTAQTLVELNSSMTNIAHNESSVYGKFIFEFLVAFEMKQEEKTTDRRQEPYGQGVVN